MILSPYDFSYSVPLHMQALHMQSTVLQYGTEHSYSSCAEG
jgi:hypothetical protein